ncbi:MAG TPA: hypothetical protein VFG19_16645 [Geobacteraceae bacterium]|nr:hypothetical protein [Geobacteraceae bacterium]
MSGYGLNMKAAVIAFALSVPVSLWAGDRPPEHGRPSGPPPEAVEACKGMSEGTVVEFTNRGGEKVRGTCRQSGGRLAAAPDNLSAPGSGQQQGITGAGGASGTNPPSN